MLCFALGVTLCWGYSAAFAAEAHPQTELSPDRAFQGQVNVEVAPPSHFVPRDPNPINPDRLPQPGVNLAPDARGGKTEILPPLISPEPTTPRHPLMGGITFRPYRFADHPFSLAHLENQRWLRSPAVIAPDMSAMAYTEVTYQPFNRQTSARLFWVPLQNTDRILYPGTLVGPTPEVQPMVENPEYPEPAMAKMQLNSELSPTEHRQDRQQLLTTGVNQLTPFGFDTLTVVDWSSSGQRLLVLKRRGVLHVGLVTSDLVVFDRLLATTTSEATQPPEPTPAFGAPPPRPVRIYPEIQHMIRQFWDPQAVLPPLDKLVWDVEPLGWAPGSDTKIYLRAFAYDKKVRQYLGLWEYDVQAQQGRLISTDQLTIPTHPNGKIYIP